MTDGRNARVAGAQPRASEERELEEIRLAFMEAHEQGQPLEQWIRRYPRYAPALIDLAIALEADARPIEPAPEETARMGAAMRRALQQARLAEGAPVVQMGQVAQTEPALGLAARARALKIGIPDLARRLQLTPDLLVKLDQGYIRLETVPQRFLAHVAQGLETTVEALLRGLQAGPQVAGGMAFYTKGRPQAAQQQTFGAALDQAGGMPASQRARWLAAAREEGLAP